jgi:putative transposase
MTKTEEEKWYECRVGRIDTDITTYRILARMAWVATKLYNTAMWHARDIWDRTGKIPSGIDLQKVVHASFYHDFVPAHTYQHAAHQVGNAFKSWFKLRKKDKTARPPGFRRKENLSSFLFTGYGFKAITNECFLMTMGRKLKEELAYPDKRLMLRVKWNTPFPEGGLIQQIEIVPQKGFFEVHAKISLPEPEWKQTGQVKAIDIGERNPVVSHNEDGKTAIFKGGEILSDLRYWNKEKARVQGEVMGRTRNGRKWSGALGRMSKRGTMQVRQAIHAMTRRIAEDCEEEDIKEVVIGDLKGIKKNEDGTGKGWNDKASQNWQRFPVRKVVDQLRYKLARRGIRLIEIDERGTSKGRCSVCGNTDRKIMRRIHRGMFHCRKCNTHINADVNGARNILHRYLHQHGLDLERPCEGSSGALAVPSIYHWDDHAWSVVG